MRLKYMFCLWPVLLDGSNGILYRTAFWKLSTPKLHFRNKRKEIIIKTAAMLVSWSSQHVHCVLRSLAFLFTCSLLNDQLVSATSNWHFESDIRTQRQKVDDSGSLLNVSFWRIKICLGKRNLSLNESEWRHLLELTGGNTETGPRSSPRPYPEVFKGHFCHLYLFLMLKCHLVHFPFNDSFLLIVIQYPKLSLKLAVFNFIIFLRFLEIWSH